MQPSTRPSHTEARGDILNHCIDFQGRLLAGKSVEIRLREWKCILDELDARFRVICNNHFHYIEPEKNVRVIKHSQPRQCAARNSLLFFSINGRYGSAEVFARARFHFDEHQRVVIATDDVDLAAAAPAKIAEQDFVTATSQISAR
jgi:hypothetical protein